jgi:hypothetical protein
MGKMDMKLIASVKQVADAEGMKVLSVEAGYSSGALRIESRSRHNIFPPGEYPAGIIAQILGP